MWAIVDSENKVLATCGYEPNQDDLSTRGESAIEFTDEVKPGWVYAAGQFTPAPVVPVVPVVVPLEELINRKLKDLYAAFLAAKFAVVWSDGLGFDASGDSILDFLSAKARAKDAYDAWISLPAESRGPEPAIVYRVWISPTAKEMRPITHTMFVGALEAGAAQQMAAYARFDQLRAQAQAATSAAELDAIVF